MRWVTMLMGLILLVFNVMLMTGPSPGLVVSSLGIALLILGPIIGLIGQNTHSRQRI
jgi:hypothetical protein